MKSSVIKRPIMIVGRRTSVSVEDAFWKGLQEIAKRRHETLSHLVTSINADRQCANLSSAIRLYVLGFYRDQHQAGAALDFARTPTNASEMPFDSGERTGEPRP
jgi:predicted DNA-binding ribbon-helix-helix protein